MKILIDTNVFIPLEPEAPTGALNSDRTAKLSSLVQKTACSIFLHPAQDSDFQRDRDDARRERNQRLADKYPKLVDPPPPREDLLQIVGNPPWGSNDWVDNQLIAALVGDAVNLLVTEDQGIRKKAKRAGLEDRVVTIDEAQSALRALFDEAPGAPPAVKSTQAHSLDERDPIFDSFRADYEGFDKWLTKCKLSHRQTWTIGERGKLAAVCIVNREDDSGFAETRGKTLKICTFKVGDSERGLRYGELVLKAVFEYAFSNEYESIFVTVFAKHAELVALLQDFGFVESVDKSAIGECVLVKHMKPGPSDGSLSPLEFNVRFGPRATLWDSSDAFAVPIKPEFHDALFPECAGQPQLIAGTSSFGNGLRKAYLCHSSTHQILPGANLLFYRSGGLKSFSVTGVTERTYRSTSADQIAGYVGKRTVYPHEAIRKMCEKGEVLAILFRQSRVLSTALAFSELKEKRLLLGYPQSIAKLKEGEREWLDERTTE